MTKLDLEGEGQNPNPDSGPTHILGEQSDGATTGTLKRLDLTGPKNLIGQKKDIFLLKCNN